MIACALALTALGGLPGTINRHAHTTETLDPNQAKTLIQLAQEEQNPYTCPTEKAKTAQATWKVAGTNLGGWLVLEPWITPSLFYQFLSSDRTWGTQALNHTGMDSKTFCAALGPEEGNKQLRRHWAAWVREKDIEDLATAGINLLRIPVGDWMYVPYEPYIGCYDGAVDELDRVLGLCEKYGIRALIDVHAHKKSQNGFDNSGETMRVKWTQVSSQGPEAITTFEHWPVRAADWLGPFDETKASYGDSPLPTDMLTFNHSLRVVENLVMRHKDSPAVWGMEPVNEPWQFIPIDWVKKFYWEGYWLVRRYAPNWTYVIHDSFRGYPAAWWDFMKGCPNKAMDTHIYQAWNRPGIAKTFMDNACNFAGGIQVMEELVDFPMIVGEWSLATDNCAMWLNGFNDNLPGFPKVTCAMVPCPEPYMGSDQPGCPPDKEEPLQGPYGTGVSGPMFGRCPVGMRWGTQEDSTMTTLAHKTMNAFNKGHGWLFWNFRTELEPRWDFLKAWRLGWFPRNVSDVESPGLGKACDENAPMMEPTTIEETSVGRKNFVSQAGWRISKSIYYFAATLSCGLLAGMMLGHFLHRLTEYKKLQSECQDYKAFLP